MSFPLFARAHGVEIGDLHASERIQRCGTLEKPRSKNGAYFWDGRRGWVFAWDGEAKTQWYDDPNAKPWTDEEKTEWKRKQHAQRARQERRNQDAAMLAGEILRRTVPGPHDYLHRKKLADSQGLVLADGRQVRERFGAESQGLQFDGCLIVPMRSLGSNNLQGVQVIAWDAPALRWEKKMLPGMKAMGAVLRLGSRTATETVLCEGYATGLSIELAARQGRLSAAVLVCFSDSNMVHVAGLLKGGRRYVFADNDKSGAGERAAKETGLPYCMADRVGFDANDLHAKEGLIAVQALLMKARSG
jgi:phage/plasmid primase-like uncharacterized protein